MARANARKNRERWRLELQDIVFRISGQRFESLQDDLSFVTDLGMNWWQVLEDLLDEVANLGGDVNDLDPGELTVGEVIDLILAGRANAA